MERNTRRTYHGVVVSDKMDKTRIVQIETIKVHPLYKKRFRENKKYKMHDEKNVSCIGDKVKMMETRPLSKDKYFTLVKITQKKEVVKSLTLTDTKKKEAKVDVVKKEVSKKKVVATKKPPIKKTISKTKPKAKEKKQ